MRGFVDFFFWTSSYISERNNDKQIKEGRKLKECTSAEKVKIKDALNQIYKESQNLNESEVTGRISISFLPKVEKKNT